MLGLVLGLVLGLGLANLGGAQVGRREDLGLLRDLVRVRVGVRGWGQGWSSS